jgi:multiple sugar transport system permease protein
MSAVARARPRARRWSRHAAREALGGYACIMPWILGFLIFTLGPMVASLYLSFTRYNVVTPPRLVGFENFAYALSGADRLFYPSMLATAKFAFLVVPVGVLTSLALAALLNRRLVGTTLFRTLFFLPTLTPVAAVAILWLWLLHPELGPINYALGLIGLTGPRWLSSQLWAIPALALVAIWASAGGTRMIIFLAGLQGVPQELYDAAEVDGAGAVARFRHVTLPMISPVILFNLVLGFIGGFRVFALAYVSTEGGPAYATWFYLLHLYQNIRDLRMGYASALAWVFFLIVLAFTYIQFRSAYRWVYYAGEAER